MKVIAAGGGVTIARSRHGGRRIAAALSEVQMGRTARHPTRWVALKWRAGAIKETRPTTRFYEPPSSRHRPQERKLILPELGNIGASYWCFGDDPGHNKNNHAT